MTDDHADQRPVDDAARLGLVVIGEAAALHSGDDAALDASEQNIRDTIAEMVDQPLTVRQEQVVERLASAGGTLTAGLSGALAAQTGKRVDDVLEGAARSVVWQQRLADLRDAEDGERDDTDKQLRADADGQRSEDIGGQQRADAGGQQRARRDEDGRDHR